MSAEWYVVTRKVTTKECPWLKVDVKRGEIVYAYFGPTYGVISPAGEPVSYERDRTPFFELPRDALEPRA